MMEPHDLVEIAHALVELTRDYLMAIQSNEDWTLKSNDYIAKQSRLVKDFQSYGDLNSLPTGERLKVNELLWSCYQLELQINNEVARQHQIVSNQMAQFRKGNNFKTTYELSSFGSGIMFDTYK